MVTEVVIFSYCCELTYIVDTFLNAIVWLRVEHDKGEDKGQQSQL